MKKIIIKYIDIYFYDIHDNMYTNNIFICNGEWKLPKTEEKEKKKKKSTLVFSEICKLLHSPSSKARHTGITLISNSHGRLTGNKIDRPTSHCCWTQLPKVHALLKMIYEKKKNC